MSGADALLALSEKALAMALQHIRICAPDAKVEAALESIDLQALLRAANARGDGVRSDIRLQAERFRYLEAWWNMLKGSSSENFLHLLGVPDEDVTAPLGDIVDAYASGVDTPPAEKSEVEK